MAIHYSGVSKELETNNTVYAVFCHTCNNPQLRIEPGPVLALKDEGLTKAQAAERSWVHQYSHQNRELLFPVPDPKIYIVGWNPVPASERYFDQDSIPPRMKWPLS